MASMSVLFCYSALERNCNWKRRWRWRWDCG